MTSDNSPRTLLQKLTAGLGCLIIIGAFVAALIGYLGPAGGVDADGVFRDGFGRALMPTPGLIQFFGRDRRWAGWRWLFLDLIWFWGSIAIGAWLLSRSSK